jgi:hypothetical protein
MNEELSPEDSFRLEVLLAQDLKAVRLDESNLVLHALTDQGEASIPLAPTCRPDKYLRLVRELLSGHALGSPAAIRSTSRAGPGTARWKASTWASCCSPASPRRWWRWSIPRR